MLLRGNYQNRQRLLFLAPVYVALYEDCFGVAFGLVESSAACDATDMNRIPLLTRLTGPADTRRRAPLQHQETSQLDTILALYGFNLILAVASGNTFGTKAMELENSCFCQCATGVRIKIGGGEHFLFLALPGL